MSANNNIKENVWAMQNELRNKEGITGIDAMHHVLMILLAKSFTIEQCQKLKIPEEFAFENMIQLNKKDRYDKFYNTRNMQNCVVRYLREKDMFGYTKDLPFQIKNPTTLEFMYNKISQITSEEIMNTYDLIGDIYEHFINREGKTMKDLGQYFTDRGLIRYLVDLCNPQVSQDGHIPTVWDPSAGTGGFLIEYIHHMKKQSDTIDWRIEKVNLHANDINKNTYCLLMQNLYYSLREGVGSTINLMDSLVTKDDQMYDFILANPPFGIKGLKYADMCQKVKDLGINGTKGEILFLQLCMAKLNDNGKCAIVVPEGVLFNCTKMYKETRKYLLENFNLKKIIKVGEGEFFKNTGVKTSVLYFEKTGQTENIEFIQVNKVNDSIEEVPLMTVEMEKIIENDYSLNMNLYKEIVLDVNEDFEVVELGDIVNQIKDPLKKEDITTEYIECINIGAVDSNSNKYNKFTIDKKDYKNKSMNIAKRGDILLSSVRPKLNKVIFVNEEVLYNSGFIIMRANEQDDSKFLYYLLTNENINRQLIEISESSSSLYPTINFKSINRIKLPKFRVNEDKIKFIKKMDEKERLINQLEKNINRAEKEAKEIMDVLFK
jgi:type I restriction enzyme M protein